jgi:tetratricopeptide (TPR) repeat protein
MRSFNTRLFLWLVGIAAVATGGVFLVHYLQTGRIAQALLWQARRAEEQGHLEETTRYLGRYLEFVPTDQEQRAHLGDVLATRVLDGDQAKVTYRLRQQALFVLEGVVANDPGRQDARRRLARVALSLGRTEVASEHLNQLHTELPNDGEVTCLLAQCLEAQGKYAEAAVKYGAAIHDAPRHRDSYVRLALLLGRPDRQGWAAPEKDEDHVLDKKPAQVLDLLVANNPDSHEAHLARWWSRRDEARDPARRAEVGRDVEEALRLAPTDGEVLLAAADLARAAGDLARARADLRKGRKLHPDDKRLHLALADVELADRKPGEAPEEAIARLNEGLQALPDQPDLLWLLANLLLDSGKLDEAGQVIGRMRKANGSPTGIDYLEARRLFADGRWAEAARLLESTRPVMERDGAAPGLLDQVDQYLATCYEQTDEPGQQLAAYDRIVARHGPQERAADALLTALEGRGRALWQLGRPDEAVTQYQDLVRRADAPKGARLELARLLIARDTLRGEHEGPEVEAALEQAAKEQPGRPDVYLVRARLLALRQDWEGARTVLAEARKRFPKKVEPWAALIELAEARRRSDEAARLIEEAERATGDHVELRLARARVWAAAAADKRGPFPQTLEKGLEKIFPPAEQTALMRGLMEVAYRAGSVQEALRLWGRLAGLPQHRYDARVKLVQIELALEADDKEALRGVLEDVQHIEGGEGPLWSYGEALRLMRRGGKEPAPADLDAAAALLERVAVQRPGWVAVCLAQADLEKLRHNPDAAIAHYQKAVELNERGPRVLRDLARLLDERGRAAEADEVLRRLPAATPADAAAQWLAVDVAWHNNDPARAARLAMAAVARDSSDYRDYLRRGSVLALSGSRREAEQDLRRATELGAERPETWVSLVRFLAATGRADEARKTIEAARARLAADQAPLALAQGYEAVGDADAARRSYQEAVKRQPGDFKVLQAAATYYLKAGLAADAEALLRPAAAGQVKLAPTEAAWARRRLALLLASYPDERHFAEALALVGLKLAGGHVEVEEKQGGATPDEQREEARTRAQVLATRERRVCRAQAIALLEDLARRGPLAADDQFRLVRLYEADDTAEKARALLVDLTTNHGDNPAYLDHYARSLLGQGQRGEAKQTVDRLAELEKKAGVEPGTWGSVELRAEVLEAGDQGDRALALSLLRDYAARRGARPEDALLVVGSLTRQQKFAEALDACDEAWRTCPAALAGRVSLAVLRAMKPTAEQCARVERHLRDAAAKAPTESLFLFYLADLYDLREDYPRAVECYRKVLALDKDNAAALNNLAWLLAQTSDRKDEARELIGRAIDLEGGRPEFLDTRAVIELAQGQAEAAIRDLDQANADQPSASRYFRLSLAYHQARDTEAARTAWQRAKALGLKPEHLHPIEQTAFRKVTSELEPH